MKLLVITTALLALTACDDSSKCQTNADCFAGEVCQAKECVTPQAADMGAADMADLGAPDAPDAAPDLALDMAGGAHGQRGQDQP